MVSLFVLGKVKGGIFFLGEDSTNVDLIIVSYITSRLQCTEYKQRWPEIQGEAHKTQLKQKVTHKDLDYSCSNDQE